MTTEFQKHRAAGAASRLSTGVRLLLLGILLTSPGAARAAWPARPDHTVVVIMENHSYSQIIGSSSAPFINSLRAQGANLTNSHAVGHPSEPNYIALFEGTTEGLTNDSCPHTYSAENIASGLYASGQTFVGYSESMPSDGYTGCSSGRYARKHNPWVNYTNVPASSNLTFSGFPADYDQLPSVAFVVPDLCDDMHDCGVAVGDAWLQAWFAPYITWAMTHNSLFVLTFDEDGGNTSTNQITTIFVGPMVQPGDSSTYVNHYGLLRTLEDLYGVPPTGKAAAAAPLTDIWVDLAPREPVLQPSRPGRRVRSIERQ